MTIFEKTDAAVRYAETLTLLGQSAADRLVLDGSRRESSPLRCYADVLYRRFLCPPLGLVTGSLPVARGYFFWMVCFMVAYSLAALLLPPAFSVPWDEIVRSSAFTWGLLGFSVIFLLFPLPSILSGSGVSNAEVGAMCGALDILDISGTAQVEAVRASIEIREKRMNERIGALRWSSAALWAFLVFFAQRFSGSLPEVPLVDAQAYAELLGWFALAILAWFLLIQSYATTMNRVLKTVQFALLEQSSRIEAAQD